MLHRQPAVGIGGAGDAEQYAARDPRHDFGIGCPNIVFPYLRETVSDVVIRAGFPPLLLNPVNFEALFAQQQQAQQQQAVPAQTH